MSTPANPLPDHHIEHGVAINPTQIEKIDSAASSSTTTIQTSRPPLYSEYFLPADLQRPTDVETRTSTLTTATVPSSHPELVPPSSDLSEPTKAVEAAVGVSRLPQSGLVLCGRKWLLGAEDMFIPACLSLLSDLFVFILALVAIALLPTSYSSMPPTCSEADYYKLQSTIICLVVCFFLLTLIDIGTMLSAWWSDMFQRNRTVPLFLYLRMAISVLITAASLAGNVFYFSTTRNACTRPYPDYHALDITTFALYVSSLVLISFLFLYFLCSYGAGQLCAPRAEDSWKSTLSTWFCHKSQAESAGDHDVFSSVATIFSEFFSSSLPSSSIHVVPSDVAVAMCLVQGMQRKRRRVGEKFYMAAGRRRWDTQYIERYYNESVRRAEEEEKKKKHNNDGQTKDEQHAALREALTSHQDTHSMPLPIKLGTSPQNAYHNKVKEEEKDAAVKVTQETTPAPAPTLPSTPPPPGDDEMEKVDVEEVPRSEKEAHEHEEHLAAGPSFADRDEEDRRERRRTPRPSVGPSPRGVAEMTEIVVDSGQQAEDLQNVKLVGSEEKAASDEGDINPYEGGDNLAGEEDEDMADVALSGRQPRLLQADWEKVAEGKHYYDFACGSYGWMLYTFNHLACIATCTLCWRRTPLNTHEMEGSGCSPFPCVPSYKTCLLSVRAFEIQSGAASSEILYCHLSRAPVYYVVIDREKKALVVSVRGTLSIADALIDLDAQLASLAPYGYPHGYTHQGILQNALHLRDHMDKKGVVAAFLRMNPDYSLVIVGHSLGAGTAAALTFILRGRFAKKQGVDPHATHDVLVGDGVQADQARDVPSPAKPAHSSTLPTYDEVDYHPRSLHCYIYGCPLLVDPITAQSPFAMSSITTFIYHDDMIARMSLASLFHLKQQMVEAYERSESRKWKIMRLAWGSKWEQLEKYDVKHPRQPRRRFINRGHSQHPPPSSNTAQGVQMTGSQRVMDRDGVSHPSDALQPLDVPSDTAPARTYPPSTQPIQVTTTAIEEKHFTNAQGERMTEVTEKKSTFSIQLRKMYLPGRIYLLLPVDSKKKREVAEGRGGLEEEEEGVDDGGFCVGRKKKWVVFPAAQESFGEVIVSGHMFNDHVPILSAWQGLNLPRQFRERQDNQEKKQV